MSSTLWQTSCKPGTVQSFQWAVEAWCESHDSWSGLQHICPGVEHGLSHMTHTLLPFIKAHFLCLICLGESQLCEPGQPCCAGSRRTASLLQCKREQTKEHDHHLQWVSIEQAEIISSISESKRVNLSMSLLQLMGFLFLQGSWNCWTTMSGPQAWQSESQQRSWLRLVSSWMPSYRLKSWRYSWHVPTSWNSQVTHGNSPPHFISFSVSVCFHSARLQPLRPKR